MQIYKFEPLLKQTIWGGEKIKKFKHLDSPLDSVGESWEISGVEGYETVVANGPDKGIKLPDLVQKYREQLVGKANYEQFGNEFPLLIKFIDACKDLSIQVHPNDEVARLHGQERGKTEMWYVLPSESEAKLYCGLKQKITPEEYEQLVENDAITDALAQYKVREDDVFYIPAGRIHAICSGTMVAEIQQTCDVTYRIYDYRRCDKNGNYRELHTKKAAESIDYAVQSDYQTRYESQKNTPVQLISCPYFTTAVYDLDEPMTIDYSELDSFVALIALSGSGIIKDEHDHQTPLRAGETVLIPAIANEIKVEGTLKFLETYV
jgi:mannose-6-phosphate isomerase